MRMQSSDKRQVQAFIRWQLDQGDPVTLPTSLAVHVGCGMHCSCSRRNSGGLTQASMHAPARLRMCMWVCTWAASVDQKNNQRHRTQATCAERRVVCDVGKTSRRPLTVWGSPADLSQCTRIVAAPSVQGAWVGRMRQAIVCSLCESHTCDA